MTLRPQARPEASTSSLDFWTLAGRAPITPTGARRPQLAFTSIPETSTSEVGRIWSRLIADVPRQYRSRFPTLPAPESAVYWRLVAGRGQLALGMSAFPTLAAAERDATEVRDLVDALAITTLMRAGIVVGWFASLDGVARVRSLPGSQLRPRTAEDPLSVAEAFAQAEFNRYVHIAQPGDRIQGGAAKTLSLAVPALLGVGADPGTSGRGGRRRNPVVGLPSALIPDEEPAASAAAARPGTPEPALAGTDLIAHDGDSTDVDRTREEEDAEMSSMHRLSAEQDPEMERLSFERTIDRRDVHRVALAEVMLTDTTHRPVEGAFVFGAQLPRIHPYFRREDEPIDLSLIAEVLRQATIALAHIYFSVPHEHAFIMSGLSVDLRPGATLPAGQSVEITVECQVSEVARRGGNLSAMLNTLSFRYAGEEFATGTGDLTVLAPRLYERIRGEHQKSFAAVPAPEPSRIRAEQLGAAHPGQIVLDRDDNHGRSWLVRVDPHHSTFFDHPSDHVPGMLLIEAARQAARLALAEPGAHVRHFSGKFTSFFDLDKPVRIQRERAVRPHLKFSVVQNDQTGAVLDVEVEE